MKSQPNKNQKEQVKEQVNEAKQDLLERFKVATATWHLTEIFCIDADVDITAQCLVDQCQKPHQSWRSVWLYFGRLPDHRALCLHRLEHIDATQ